VSTRVFADLPLASGAELALDKGASHHLAVVLRMKPGADLLVFNGRGGEFEARVARIERKTVWLSIGAHYDVARESALRLTLAQGIAKGDRMDYTVQKAVELGVSCIVPVLAERSVVRVDAERWDRKQQHWQEVARSAAEQSGRTMVPRVEPVITLPQWLSQPRIDKLRLVLDPQGGATLRGLEAPQGGVSLLVGPEGGLSDAELRASELHGFLGLRLGPRVLRTETAGIAAIAAIQALWGDWS
jgi:16S rRNA (uracil1498-N3)-methyltransferase